MNKKLLIITGGPLKKLDSFQDILPFSGLDTTLASFSNLSFVLEPKKDFILKVKGKDIGNFDIIYIRLVGKRLEDATLLVNYATDKGVRIVDRLYKKSLFLPSSISKAIEMRLLANAGISLPKTFYGSLERIAQIAPRMFGYPFVIKSTSGKKARDAWSPRNLKEFKKLLKELEKREKKGDRFFAQEFIEAGQRVRVLVVGSEVVGAISRPTKWRSRFTSAEPEKKALIPVPKRYAEIALKAAEAVFLDIAGVDILTDEVSGKVFVIEANAAPSWKALAKDTGINIEEKILSYLKTL